MKLLASRKTIGCCAASGDPNLPRLDAMTLAYAVLVKSLKERCTNKVR